MASSRVQFFFIAYLQITVVFGLGNYGLAYHALNEKTQQQ